ncbi:MAG: PASTA domain-containing protein [Bacteroidales bacterium]|jgi:beta-lactam-binding protein with PASTA domain|nr:PASTA domain-containing protein [Bacteroidales bacterium]
MGKFRDFFKPQRMGFHLVLAIIITMVLAVVCLIILKSYTRHGREVDMPNFVGQNSVALIDTLLPSDYIIVITDEVYDKTMEPGTIIKQNPEAGEKVKKGRKVYLTVATSEPPTVIMPELRDVSLRQAEIMLNALGLELEGTILKPSPYENAVLEQLHNGRVIAAGTKIKMGDKITLVVGRDISELPVGADSTLIEN